jgi:DNA-binding GntR family transcriptional regulator
VAETAHQQVLDSLRSAIVRRELTPGMPVRADAVAERFGVSRIPVREALRVLEAEGLVTSRPHKGMVVTEMSPVDLHEIYLLRRLLETEATRRAVAALSRVTLAELARLVERMDEAVERGDVELAELNRAFHFTLYDASGLDHLTRIIRMLWNQSDAYRAFYLANEAYRRQAQDGHHAILEAAQGRDAERVVALLDAHRTQAEVAISEMLRAAPPAPVKRRR